MFKKANSYQSLCVVVLALTCSFSSMAQEQSLQAKLPKETTEGLSYALKKDQNHVIHILSIDPKQYNLKLVKAHNQVFGRETVPEMALRTNAVAAINAGFFEIGKNEDGRPSGTLVIDGNIFALSKTSRSLFQLNNDMTKIGNGQLSLNLKIGENSISPDTVNLFCGPKGIALYTHVWGPTSLTPYDRREILIDKDHKITQVIEHGDNAIPPEGWILSIPKSSVLPGLTLGERVAFENNFKDDLGQIYLWQGTENFVMGIPLLVKQGHVVEHPKEASQKVFMEMPHARTAIGVKPDGTIVMVVAEHVYKRPFREMTLEQAKNILKDKQISKDKINQMTVPEALAVIQKDSIENSNIIGLTLPELAKLMVDLGCYEAINLDGGGSSTLFLNAKVMNTTIGDQDEGMGQVLLRPVSDAIVVQKRN